ncbi:MAG: DNA-3-methyladenine glycosylase 2 family protein [Planctomycetota bacterium]|nr:DNA-3-methyladenine glycosylase 2 family protein [Planctomycetota bacterium]
MGLTKRQIKTGLDRVALVEPKVAQALKVYGYPGTRHREKGYATLLRTIVGQQVSVAAANSVWLRLEELLGEGCEPGMLLREDFDALRACGLSRQKQGYARSLAELVVSGEVQLDALPKNDEEAIEYLVQVKGIGRWSAEVYLLFAEGRRDMWPAGDLAVRIGVGTLLGLEERPSEKEVRTLAEPWAPYRGSMALFAWHCYNTPAL